VGTTRKEKKLQTNDVPYLLKDYHSLHIKIVAYLIHRLELIFAN
jgi:hypothetical protein